RRSRVLSELEQLGQRADGRLTVVTGRDLEQEVVPLCRQPVVRRGLLGPAQQAAERSPQLGGPHELLPGRRHYFGPSGTNRASSPLARNHSTIASCGGFSIP